MQQPEYKSNFSLHLIPREGATRLGSAWLLADDLAQKRLVHLAPHCPPVSQGRRGIGRCHVAARPSGTPILDARP
jgi:hypothetical protein